MKCSLDFPSSFWLAKIDCKIAVIALTAILLLPSPLPAQVKKVPFPFSPIGLNCLPWFVAKEARIFDKYAIEFDPVFIGASSALFNAMLSATPEAALRGMVKQMVQSNLIDAKAAANTAMTAYYDSRYVEEVKQSGFFEQLWR